MAFLNDCCEFDELTEELHGESVASRYLIVDAINTEKVLKFYARNGFMFAFPDEQLEREYVGVKADEELRTRFMLFDLMPVMTALKQ